jgi:hypothetical protein
MFHDIQNQCFGMQLFKKLEGALFIIWQLFCFINDCCNSTVLIMPNSTTDNPGFKILVNNLPSHTFFHGFVWLLQLKSMNKEKARNLNSKQEKKTPSEQTTKKNFLCF